MQQKNLMWVDELEKHIGLTEVKGPLTNPVIKQWLHSLSAWWTDDETPWCGTAVANALKLANRALPTHWYRAKDYLNTGTMLNKPAYGCIAVTSRTGGGHVFFVVGKTLDGRLVGLGGNQGNAVNYRTFNRESIVGYRWPALADGSLSTPDESRYDLPLFDNNIKPVSSMA